MPIESQDNKLVSVESERLILSAILQGDAEHKMLRAIRKRLKIQDFGIEQHANIWAMLCTLDDEGEPIDPAALSDRSRAMDLFLGGAEYLGELMTLHTGASASADSVNSAAERVLDLSFRRQAERSLTKALTLCRAGSDFDAVANYIEDDMINLRRQREHNDAGPQHLGVFAAKATDNLMHVSEHGLGAFSFQIGHPSFDRATNGLQRGDLIIIAGRPSMGKTAAMLYVANGLEAQSTADFQVTPLIFSLEMSGERLALRQIAAAAGIPVNTIRRADMTDAEWNAIPDALESVSSRNIYIDETPGLLLPELRARAREHVAQFPNSPILIDYMQIVGVGQESQRKEDRQKIGEISGSLKQLARELNVPVVALSQLNRDLEKRANKRPILSDLRESGAIEQDADVIVFLYRDEVYNPETPDKGISEWIIGKQRDGETRTIRNTFLGNTMSYADMGYDDA